MRAGELLVLFLMLLSYLYHFKSVTARALLWATAIAIYVLCQTLQIYLLGKPATLTDAIDPLRFFIPLAAILFRRGASNFDVNIPNDCTRYCRNNIYDASAVHAASWKHTSHRL